MNDQHKEDLKAVAAEWASTTVYNWVGAWEAWDNLIEDGDLSEDDWEYIRDNFKFNIIVEEK